uniref:Uncharacterized protein n=1 Tax=Panagrolaimus davidi TaxID=227884 RepID=A0A914QKC8_9BILA
MGYYARNCVSLIIPQIYRCDTTKLFLDSQILAYNEFLFLSGSVEILHLDFCGIYYNKNGTVGKNEDHRIVPLEKLVKTLVNLKQIAGDIDPSHSYITKNTVKELLETPHFSKLYHFHFDRLPEVFDVDAIFAYLKYTKFCLHFAGTISEEYKVRIEKIVDEILQTETHDYKPPLITFDGLAAEKKRKMNCLYDHSSGL